MWPEGGPHVPLKECLYGNIPSPHYFYHSAHFLVRVEIGIADFVEALFEVKVPLAEGRGTDVGDMGHREAL